MRSICKEIVYNMENNMEYALVYRNTYFKVHKVKTQCSRTNAADNQPKSQNNMTSTLWKLAQM